MSSSAPSYAARYRARLVAALEPFALVACAWIGVAGRALREARERNRAVALKLAVLSDPVAKAALRRKLGGHRALWDWEMRAQARVREMHGRLKRAVRAGVGTGRREAGSRDEDWDELDDLLAEAFAVDAAMDARTDTTPLKDDGTAAATDGDDMESPRGARPIRFALPSLPRVDVGDGGPNYLGWTGGRRRGVVERRRRARVVRVWPSELMSARENAEMGHRRALRRKRLAEKCGGCGTGWWPKGPTPPWVIEREWVRHHERQRIWRQERERARARDGPRE